jgi:hypothetical protein
MQRERTNRAQVPRTFARLEQRRARYQNRLGATPPAAWRTGWAR